MGRSYGRAVALREDGCLSHLAIARLLGSSAAHVQDLERAALRKMRLGPPTFPRPPHPPEELALDLLHAQALALLAECDPLERDRFREFGELPRSVADWLERESDSLGRTGT